VTTRDYTMADAPRPEDWRCTAEGCPEVALGIPASQAIAAGWDIFTGLCPTHHTGYVPRRPPLCPLCPSKVPVLLGIHYR